MLRRRQSVTDRSGPRKTPDATTARVAASVDLATRARLGLNRVRDGMVLALADGTTTIHLRGVAIRAHELRDELVLVERLLETLHADLHVDADGALDVDAMYMGLDTVDRRFRQVASELDHVRRALPAPFIDPEGWDARGPDLLLAHPDTPLYLRISSHGGGTR